MSIACQRQPNDSVRSEDATAVCRLAQSVLRNAIELFSFIESGTSAASFALPSGSALRTLITVILDYCPDLASSGGPGAPMCVIWLRAALSGSQRLLGASDEEQHASSGWDGFVVPMSAAVRQQWEEQAFAPTSRTLELAWERLHTGHWASVPEVWRHVYEIAATLMCVCYLRCGHDERALCQADMALLIGGRALQSSLNAIVQACETRLPPLALPDLLLAVQADSDLDSTDDSRTSDGDGDGDGGVSESASDGNACAQAGASAAAATAPPPPRYTRAAAPLPVLQAPSLSAFAVFLHSERPVVLRGAMQHWPALQRWSDPAYLVRAGGRRTVPVETGGDYASGAAGTRLMRLGEYVARVCAGRATGLYLAQHTLLDQVAPLRADIAIPEYCALPPRPPSRSPGAAAATAEERQRRKRAASPMPAATAVKRWETCARATDAAVAAHGDASPLPRSDQDRSSDGGSGDRSASDSEADAEPPPEVRVNAWYGPGGTVSRLHTDPPHNLLCQVVGRKYVRLYSPQHSAALCPYPDPPLQNTSQIDLDAADALRRYPQLATLPFVDCVLEPGDMVYIPPRWWHYVRSLETSFSVSFWWGDHA